MSPYRFLRAIGFEHEDAVGGLLPEHPTRPVEEKRHALEQKQRRLFECLVRHRRAIEALRQRIVPVKGGRVMPLNERDLVSLRRHEDAYRDQLDRMVRLRREQARIQEQLLRT